MSAPAEGQGAARRSLHATVLEVLPELVLIHDQEQILFANAACRRFLAAACPEELEGRPIAVIIHPDAIEAGRERRRLLIEGERSLRAVPLKLVTVDGETKHVTADAHPITFNGTQAALIVAQAQPT